MEVTTDQEHISDILAKLLTHIRTGGTIAVLEDMEGMVAIFLDEAKLLQVIKLIGENSDSRIDAPIRNK